MHLLIPLLASIIFVASLFCVKRVANPGSGKAGCARKDLAKLPAPLARYRPEYPFPSCVPALLGSVIDGISKSTPPPSAPQTYQRQSQCLEKSITRG